MSWIKVLLYVTPVAALVYNRCAEMGMNPLFPVLGLVLGIVLEMQR